MSSPALHPAPPEIAATERALRQLLEIVPDDAFTHFKLGQFLAGQNRAAEAAIQFRRAIDLQNDFPEALRGLAAIHVADREFALAVDLLRQAVTFRPEDDQSLCDLGNALVNICRGREAVVYLRRALLRNPNEHRLHSNLGLAYTEAGLFDEAEASFRQALRLRPLFAAAHINLANLYIMLGRHDQALACLDLARNIDPNNINAQANRAISLLSLGDFEQGWAVYQKRWLRPESPHRRYAQPLWTGQDIAGRRILLHTEEGLGDRIQFIRYAALLKEKGANVICETPMPLLDIFQGVAGIDEIVPLGSPLPPFDVHAPLLSLPHYFHTSLETLPNAIPYLHANADLIVHWEERLSQLTTPRRLRAGIAWQGNPNHQFDRFRSIPLKQFEPLARLTNIQLVSLQRGPGIEQIERFQRVTENGLMVPTDGAQSTPSALADTAALLCCLDLVITVDTATAHLAGALGRPTWVLLSTVTDWRWMTRRSDSPWYPTLRLFRQRNLNDWGEVLDRVAAGMGVEG